MLPPSSPRRFYFALIALMVAFITSLLLGYQSYGLYQLVQAFAGEVSEASYILLDLRLPRAILAPVVGAALAVAGVMLQSMTRNPLTSPDIIGMNSAAALVVVVLLTVMPGISLYWLNVGAISGAGCAGLLVYLLAKIGHDKHSLLKLPLLGAVITLFFSAMTQVILTLDEAVLEKALFWLAGSVTDRGYDLMQVGLPVITLGFVLTALCLRQMELLHLDESHAHSMGVNIKRLHNMVLLSVALLVGGSVVLAGPIGFIGLVIPQFAKLVFGYRHRILIPGAALMGALLLTLADVLSRFVIYPQEAPVGVVTAIIGVPLFIYYVVHHTSGEV